MARTELAPITDLEGLSKLIKSGKTVVVGGVFDILHSEHIDQLKEAAELGDTLVVHVTGDKRVKEKKGDNRPIFNEELRAKIIASIRFVDHVFIYNGRHYDQEVVDNLSPDVICFHRKDYTDEVKQRVSGLKNFHGEIGFTKHDQTISTSAILEKLKKL